MPGTTLYRIPETVIDASARHDEGTEVAVTLLATVVDDPAAATRTLRPQDWIGPSAQPHDPGTEPSLRRAERAIVRALKDAGIGEQSQVTTDRGFVIAVDGLTVIVREDEGQ